MDMRAESKLQPSDGEKFEFVVFGGILGDHPPQDRAKEFRSRFKHIRQLGTVQMTTDTALLTSHEILEGQINFDELKFIDDPEIPTNNIVHFLDEVMPLKKLESANAEAGTQEHFDKQFEQLVEKVSDFKNHYEGKAMAEMTENRGSETVNTSEATIMEGFRYRVNSDCSPYPVLKQGKEVKDFPVLPIGMLDIWREQMDEDREFGM